MPPPFSDADRAATRATAAAAAATAAAAGGGGGVVPAADGAGGVPDPPPAQGVEGALLRIQQTLDAVSTRLAAVEADREAERDPPPLVPPVLPATLAPAPAAAATAGAAGADFGLPAAGLADDIAVTVANVIKQQQAKDKEHDTAVKDDLFSDEKAGRVATLTKPLDFFLLPGCARTDFPAPFRLETWRYSADWPVTRREQRSAAAAETGHLSIVGAWSSKMHNDILSFCGTDGVADVTELQQMLQRSRVYLHQIAELCACRYDVLNNDDEDIAAEIQSRILGSADDLASKALGNVYKEVRADRNKDIVKSLSAAQRKSRRGQLGKSAAAAAAGGGN
ncbi:hypothetical protein I4F81_011153 [Pyropia yezoensis]|uniref:Uncharacterized protein n=1 Tax=Pyropia yezoensis TaxID=2788 RepID=A0ACC3CEG0_PYRYE|nr:hypothetical protein I4F81_011153 [Neopyropia yezoensis]